MSSEHDSMTTMHIDSRCKGADAHASESQRTHTNGEGSGDGAERPRRPVLSERIPSPFAEKKGRLEDYLTKRAQSASVGAILNARDEDISVYGLLKTTRF